MKSTNPIKRKFSILGLLCLLPANQLQSNPPATEISPPPKTTKPGKSILTRESPAPTRNRASFSESLSGKIPLQKGSVTLTIHFNRGHKKDARYFIKISKRFLPAVEKMLRKPLHPPHKKMIVYGKGASIGGYETIYVNTKNGKGHPALLFHEYGHLWYPGMAGLPAWLHQGIVSFLPVYMYHSKKLQLTRKEFRSILNGWAFYTVDETQDLPLLKGKQGYKHFYTKTYKIQYLIYRELGQAGYLRFLRELLGGGKLETKDVLTLLSEIKPMDWRKFLSGWVFPGPYRKFAWHDFNDSDWDGLLNIQEYYEGTNKNLADTDGDGYSDNWELKNGYAPLAPESPGPVGRPIVDGVADPIQKKPIYTRTDPKGDAKASTDISKLSVYRFGKLIFIRVNFHKRDSKRLYHTLHLRDPERRKNYWLQVMGAGDQSPWIKEFQDGTSYKNWSKSSLIMPPGSMGSANVFEFAFDPRVFGFREDFLVTYISGGYKNNKFHWHSDSTEPAMVSVQEPFIRIDGDARDMHKKIIMHRLNDSRGDAKADEDIHDLKEFRAGVKEGFLYVSANFYESVAAKKLQTTVLHVKIPGTKQNFWIDFYGTSLAQIRVFDDGASSSNWRKINLNVHWKRYSATRFARNRDLEIKLPVTVFDPGARLKKFRLKIILGGTKNKKWNWYSDSSGWLETK